MPRAGLIALRLNSPQPAYGPAKSPALHVFPFVEIDLPGRGRPSYPEVGKGFRPKPYLLGRGTDPKTFNTGAFSPYRMLYARCWNNWGLKALVNSTSRGVKMWTIPY